LVSFIIISKRVNVLLLPKIKTNPMKIAVMGATGLVGRKMLEVLGERRIFPDMLIPVASEKSVGKSIIFGGKEISIRPMQQAIAEKPDIALFSAGGATSHKWAKAFADAGCFVIDNSSVWRMDDRVPLVVPEINAKTISRQTKIIANPNCSTIQMVLALAPLHWKYKIKRVVVSTYQSVTGSGIKGVRQLQNERKNIEGEQAYSHPIDLNLIPQGGSFDASGYTSEEVKLVNETRKILGSPEIMITATVVRVPVYGGHSESVNIAFENDFELEEVKQLLKLMPGIVVQDDPENAIYPMPRFAEEKDDVFVGRIRRDHSNPNSLNLWIVSDNLRKGAATNAVQIAEHLIHQNLV
jgi:aspartate-semialdehyde dehydrogenase